VRDFNKIETRAVIKFLFLQGKEPKKIHAILTETLACILPGRATDLSAPLYIVTGENTGCLELDLAVNVIITVAYSFNKRLSIQEFHSFRANHALFTALLIVRHWSLLYQKNLVYDVTLYF